jgi:hypothetical protein
MMSTARYKEEFAKAQEIAKMEQDRGFLPVKKNGKITQPSAIVSNALTQIDQLGTTVIMEAPSGKDANKTASAYQITQGALISTLARTFNYYASDAQGKEEIRNKNDQFPFSLDYKLNTGIGLSVGGATFSTGAGAIAGQIQIGNVCATVAGAADGTGAIVDIKGRKYNCKTMLEVSGTAPSATFTAP